MKNEIEKLLKKEASVIEQNIKFDAMETRRNADQLQKVLRKVPLDAWEKSGYHGVKKVEIRKYPRNQGVDVELKIGTCTTRHINNLDSLDYLNLELVAYSQDYLDYCRRKAENLVEILNDIEKSNKFISHLKVNKEYYKMLFREAMPDGQYRVYFTRLNLDNILMKYCQENSINSVTAICKMAKSLRCRL